MANYADWTAFSWMRRASSIGTVPPPRTTFPTRSSLGICMKSRSAPGGNGFDGDIQAAVRWLADQRHLCRISRTAVYAERFRVLPDMPGNAQDAGPRARFGTVGRNTMRGPGVVNMDLSLFRTFR